MQVKKRTAKQWFDLWTELADVRRILREQRDSLPMGSAREELTRAVALADARATLAFVRYLMVEHNLNQSDIADLLDWFTSLK